MSEFSHQKSLTTLLQEVRACTICKPFLPLGCNPILQLHSDAKILLVGQAPGKRAHESNTPFNDPSGDRLRTWLGVDRDTFYDPHKIALLPMGFCYPGTGENGDLPPRPECAEQWRETLLAQLPHIQLTIVIGQYARDWHFPEQKKLPLSDLVKNWQLFWPERIVVPHPSPRNMRWFRNHPWFENEIVPMLQAQVNHIISV